jgi:hypothetical protein
MFQYIGRKKSMRDLICNLLLNCPMPWQVRHFRGQYRQLKRLGVFRGHNTTHNEPIFYDAN